MTSVPESAFRVRPHFGPKGNPLFIVAIAGTALLAQFGLTLAQHSGTWAENFRFGAVTLVGVAALITIVVSGASVYPFLARAGVITSVGGLGMSIGAFISGGGCCAAATDAMFSTLGMLVFCFIGCRLCPVPAVMSRQASLLGDLTCPLLMFPGMWLGVLLLHGPLLHLLSNSAAAHESMLAGMFVGTFWWERFLAFASRFKKKIGD